eukprot:2588663-Prymnesium_polylepis.1
MLGVAQRIMCRDPNEISARTSYTLACRSTFAVGAMHELPHSGKDAARPCTVCRMHFSSSSAKAVSAMAQPARRRASSRQHLMRHVGRRELRSPDGPHPLPGDPSFNLVLGSRARMLVWPMAYDAPEFEFLNF